MKILGTEYKYSGKIKFCLYLVDRINPSERFEILQKKPCFGRPKLDKVVFSNGNVRICDWARFDKRFVTIEYCLEDADWYLIVEGNLISLYVTEGYKRKIKTKNAKINGILEKCYESTVTRIINKRNFARKISYIAKRLGLPFELVLAFKGDEYELQNFVVIIQKEIKNKIYLDLELIENADNFEIALHLSELLGYNIPEEYNHGAKKIAKYAYECLVKGSVIYIN